MNSWTEALRTYNRKHNNKFCIPYKGTDEFAKSETITEKNTTKISKI